MAQRNKEIEKIQDYLRRHSFVKRWVSVMVVVTLLITVATLYAMNKSASAVTEEGAEEVGMVLSEASESGASSDENTSSDETESEIASEETTENKDEAAEEISEDNTEDSESADTAEDSESADTAENSESADTAENSECTDTTENSESTDAAENSESTDTTDNSESADTADNSGSTDATDNSAAGITEDSERSSIERTDNAKTTDDSETETDNTVNDSNESKEDSLQETNTEEGSSQEKSSEDTVEGGTAKEGELSEEGSLGETTSSEDALKNSDADNSDVLTNQTEKEETPKISTLDVPESVDVANYVTKTVIERELSDGSWEEITEQDIEPGDRLRITVKYVLPVEATVSDNIYYELPEQFGKAEIQSSQVENADASYEVNEDNHISIQYSEEYKKETLNEASSEEESTDDQDEEKSEAGDDSLSLGGVITDFFRENFVITAHASSNESEMVVYSSVSGMKIRNASLKKNPTPYWENNSLKYKGGTEIESGTSVTDGDTILFTLEYLLGIGTLKEGKTTTSYNLLECGINVSETVSDYIYNSDNEQVGTFTIDKDTGIATFEFFEKFAKNNETQIIYGNFFFVAKAELAEGEKDKTITYDFGQDLTFEISIIKGERYDLLLKKSCKYDSNNGTVLYTIKISSKDGTDGAITLEDVLKIFNNKHNDYNENSELERIINTTNQISNISVKTSDGSVADVEPSLADNKMSMVLPKLGEGGEYTITYSFALPEAIRKSVIPIKLKNEAIAKDERNSSSGYTIMSFEGSIPKIRKWSPSVDTNNRTVTWEIILNENEANLKGYTLIDEIWQGYNGRVAPDVEVSVTPAINGKNTISLKNGYKFENDDYHKYTFRYTCTYDETNLVWDAQLVNYAYIKLDDNTSEYADAYRQAENINFVRKAHGDISYDQNNSGWVDVTWNVSLLAPIKNNAGTNGSEYWTYVDNMSPENHLITSDQLSALQGELSAALTRAGYTGTFEIVNKKPASKEGRSGYSSFTIKFKGDLNQNIDFSYSTSGFIGDNSSTVKFENEATVHKQKVKDSVSFEGFKLDKMDGQYNSNDSDPQDYYSDTLYNKGILTWIIDASIPKNTAIKKAVITDTLPDNVTLLSLEGEKYSGETLYGVEVSTDRNFSAEKTLQLNSVARQYGVSYNVSGKKISLDVDVEKISSMIQDSKVDVYVRVRAKIDDSFDFENLKSGKFTNTVTFGTDNNTILAQDTQTQTVTKTNTVIKKTSNAVSEAKNTFEYSVDINPNAADLLQRGDTLTMTDTLISKATSEVMVTLLPSSIHVYELEEGVNNKNVLRELNTDEYSYETMSYSSKTSDWNGNVNTGQIIFKLPDKKHLKIVYRYTFNGNDQTQIELSNAAKLSGISFENNSTENKTQFTVKDAGASANTKGIEVYKVDKDNNAVKLAGARFTLYKWIDNSTKWQAVTELDGQPINLITGEDGKLSISPLTFNNAYKLVEEEAPENYLISNEPLVFYVSVADKKKYPMNLPDDFAENFGVVYTPGQKVNFANDKKYTEITISKKWKSADDTMPSKVDFVLKRQYTVDNSTASTTSFRSVHVDSRTANDYIVGYTGFSYVKDGSVLNLTLEGFKEGNYVDLPTVIVNGEEVKRNIIESLFSDDGAQLVNYSITVDKDLKIIVKSSSYDKVDRTNPILEEPVALRNGNNSGTIIDDTFNIPVQLFEDKEDPEKNWRKTYRDLEKYKIDGDKKYEYQYFISEVNTVFYSIVKDESNMGPITSGELWITNERNDVQAYELPETGGIGTTVFAIGGISVMAIAIMLEELLRKKKRK